MPIATLTIDEVAKGEYALTGCSGVNAFRMNASLKGAKIATTGEIATTRMAGPPEVMAAEEAFLSLLAGATTASCSTEEGRDVLTLSGDQGSLRFRRFTLADTSWKVVAMNDGMAVASLDENAGLTLTFGADGQASAFTGINQLAVAYSLQDNRGLTFSFDDGISTLAAGSPEDMAAEGQYKELLAGVASYSLHGNELSLYDSTGEMLLVCTVQDLL